MDPGRLRGRIGRHQRASEVANPAFRDPEDEAQGTLIIH